MGLAFEVLIGYLEEERVMKRIMAVLLMVAFAFTLAGCACGPAKECPAPCLDRIQALEAKCQADMRAVEAAVAKAEAAARRAEAAADKCESIFMKHMKK